MTQKIGIVFFIIFAIPLYLFPTVTQEMIDEVSSRYGGQFIGYTKEELGELEATTTRGYFEWYIKKRTLLIPVEDIDLTVYKVDAYTPYEERPYIHDYIPGFDFTYLDLDVHRVECDGFITYYSKEYKTPIVSIYKLTSEMVKASPKTSKRENGYLIPIEDLYCNTEALKDAKSDINIIADPKEDVDSVLGIIENTIRSAVLEYGDAIIITGPYIRESMFGDGFMISKDIWKAVYFEQKGDPTAPYFRFKPTPTYRAINTFRIPYKYSLRSYDWYGLSEMLYPEEWERLEKEAIKELVLNTQINISYCLKPYEYIIFPRGVDVSSGTDESGGNVDLGDVDDMPRILDLVEDCLRDYEYMGFPY